MHRANPRDVFTTFEDFDGPLDWSRRGNAEWSVGASRLTVKLPVDPNDETSASILAPARVSGPAVIEARIRFLEYPTRNDVGLVYASARDGSARIAYLHGQGAVYLGRITPQGKLETVGGNNWFWKSKAGRWSVLQADWSAPLIQVQVDGVENFRFADLESGPEGQIGLGTRRGTGRPVIEIDWFRVRHRYAYPPKVIVDPNESRKSEAGK